MSPGRHFAANALGALAAGRGAWRRSGDRRRSTSAAGRRPPGAARANASSGPRRGNRIFDLIDDAFNANPASMAAALDVLIAARPARRRRPRRHAAAASPSWATCWSLAPTEIALHQAIARHPGLDAVAHHPLRRPAHAGALAGPAARTSAANGSRPPPELAAQARTPGRCRATSCWSRAPRASKVSLVVDALRKLGQAASGARHRGTDIMLYWLDRVLHRRRLLQPLPLHHLPRRRRLLPRR